MKAGIDLGSTLIKVAYKFCSDNSKVVTTKFLSSADRSVSQIAEILKQNKITHANITGINKLPKQLNFLKIKKIKDKNLINREIKLQVKGLEYLEKKLSSKYILVSIGTGISYTIVNGRKIKKIPIGSSIGGGTILGLSKKLGFENFNELVKLANQGSCKNTDIYFKNLIVSNLANVSKETKKADLAAGLMNLLAVTVYKDMMLYKLNYQKIIVIGSTLKNNVCLKRLLRKYLSKIIFISNSEYATCLGALLSGRN